jgi:4-hydroxy-2-oxoglutarate aldolase
LIGQQIEKASNNRKKYYNQERIFKKYNLLKKAGKIMNNKLKGVFIPVVTPFTDQKVDLLKLAHNIQRTRETAIAGYMPLGSNGEFAHMNDEEQLSVLDTIKNNAKKDKVFMVGIARPSAYNTIEFGKRVTDRGADFVSVLTPSYFTSSMTDDALIKYYTKVADGLSVPVLLYNCPKFAAGISLSENVVAELAKHPNIAGMKDTSKGNIEAYLSAVEGEEFDVLAGSIENYFAGLLKGAAGSVVSMANYLPNECSQIQVLFEEGKIKQAEELSSKLNTLNQAGPGKYGVAGVKASCDLFGYKGGEVRLPLLDCTAQQKEAIKQVFLETGILQNS